MSIGQRLKQIRAQLSKTQLHFAEFFDMSRENYAKIEGNGRYPSIEMLIILHDKFGIDLNWLICKSGKMKFNEKESMSGIVSEPQTEYQRADVITELRDRLKDKDTIIALKDAEIERLRALEGKSMANIQETAAKK